MRAALLLSMACVALCACGGSREDSLTAQERQATPASDEGAAAAPVPLPDGADIPEPVAARDAGAVVVRVMSESGYVNERRQYVVDLLERDYAYLSARVQTPEGRPVKGARVRFEVKGSSRLAGLDDPAAGGETDDSGTLEFGLVGGAMGLDVVRLSVGDASTDVVANVISLKAAGYQTLADVKGALRWDDLLKARVRYQGDAMGVEFPAAVAARSGQAVKLTGFMMPLEPEQKQRHFLLASNPPSCFFHVPGGPAGAVEIFAPKGVAASWDPIVLEGRFETVANSEMGVIYRLRDARAIRP